MRIAACVAAAAATVVLACGKPSGDNAAVVQGGSSAESEIRLDRTACFHSCPEYGVSVTSNGAVRYTGLNNVAMAGLHRATIPADSAALLFRFADSVRLDTLAGQYVHGTRGCEPYIADLPGVIVTVVGVQAGARIEADPGCPSAPKALLRPFHRSARSSAPTPASSWTIAPSSAPPA